MQNKRSLRLIGYARVSTEDQARGESINMQVETIRRFVEGRGHSLVRVVHQEGGESGTLPLHKRPVLNAAIDSIETAREDGPQGLVFARIDRVSRNSRMFYGLIERSKKAGWSIFSATERYLDSITAMDRFTVAMLIHLAQLQSERIGEHVAYNMHGLRMYSRRSMARYTPFGFRLGEANGPFENAPRRRIDDRKVGSTDTRKLVPCPTEMQLRERIVVSMDLTGSTAKSQLRRQAAALADMLNLEGVPYPRSSIKWSPSRICRIYETAKRHMEQRTRRAREYDPQDER